MRSLPTRITCGLIAALVLSLALAHLHPFGDANLFAAQRSQPPQLAASIPPEARTLLAAHCADCHSSTARAPFYGHFAPVSWMLEHDIVEARDHLNLSSWDQYSLDRQQVLFAEIAQQARAGHMPPPQYLLIHRSARLTAAGVATLTAWTHAASLALDSATDPPSSGTQLMERSSMSWRAMQKLPSSRAERAASAGRAVEGPPHLSFLATRTPLEPRTASLEPSALLPPDPTRGQDLFNRRCTGCHSLTQNREGPHLAGVYGRPAASVPGFPYSVALAAAHITWDEQTLNRWLTDPGAFIPGVNMDFRVPRPQERADIIAFLEQSAK